MQDISSGVKEVICSTVSTGFEPRELPDEFKLAGDSLDSMAVTNLILALEDYFDVEFDDDDLSAEAFETVATLTDLVARKMDSNGA
jgi:acyl carrier protein